MIRVCYDYGAPLLRYYAAHADADIATPYAADDAAPLPLLLLRYAIVLCHDTLPVSAHTLIIFAAADAAR